MERYRLNDQSCEPLIEQSVHPVSLLSCPDQMRYLVTYEGKTLSVQDWESGKKTIWHLYQRSGQLKLEWGNTESEQPKVTELMAAVEAAFVYYPNQAKLYFSAPVRQFGELFDSGVMVKTEDGRDVVYVELFWQQARVWLSSSRTQPYPIYPVFTYGRRHPLRPPKPAGTVYRRYITWLGRTLSFRTVDLTTDLVRFNRWMNDPAVAEFWQETGDLAKHRAYLEGIQNDPHVISLIACFDDEPFGYFEIYWAKEDRIAPYYDVDDFDRGWHVLIGEPHLRGKPFVTAWLPSISHYLFLDDDRTQRIVIEPRADNHKMIRNLARCGYALLKEFDFPHKRAMLGMLLRERFFAEQLWVPRSTPPLHSVSLS
ncbi:GNAT family N-acetyltransferase [Nitrosomonas sp. Is37]|uniref:GNAT family N-acetyltransferase n=1 Tax=Nitrosomonas sp. Is37 TaxID=3080535 RepID=UPI00294B483F|nr:GNAT family N-acetyltransferase [Nitrosomonas sp. Is37]MDV6344031.1 GNAT family N-acetyltransferase [Nitrosomonas sp. Is37]